LFIILILILLRKKLIPDTIPIVNIVRFSIYLFIYLYELTLPFSFYFLLYYIRNITELNKYLTILQFGENINKKKRLIPICPWYER